MWQPCLVVIGAVLEAPDCLAEGRDLPRCLRELSFELTLQLQMRGYTEAEQCSGRFSWRRRRRRRGRGL